MSITIEVELPLGVLPTEGEIIQRAQSLGAGLAFPDGFDAATHDGYVPCTLFGQIAGFEYLIEQRNQSWLLHFGARSSYSDYAAAATVASSLALICGGTLSDDGSPPVSGDQLLEWYRTVELPAKASGTDILRVPVTVDGPQGNTLLRLKLGKVPPGAHLMRALVQSIPLELVPPALRKPNSKFVLLVRDAHEVVGIESAPSSTRHSTDA